MADANKETETLNESMEELVSSLNSQIVQIQSWLKCRHIKTSEEDKDELIQIEKRIGSLESTVSAMDENIRKEEESLMFIQRMSECLQLYNKKISYITNNLPNQLPHISDHYKLASSALSLFIHNDSESLQIHGDNNSNYNSNSNKRKATTSISLDTYNENPRAIKRRKMNDNQFQSQSQSQSKKKEMPQIEIVGKDEFEAVPKYVKQRLTQNRVNDSINEFNKVLIAKYRILQMNPSKMHKHQFDFYERCTKQETKETKQMHWLSRDDFKDSKNFTCDQTGKAIFNVMRHLKRIKMISGKKPKYAIL